MEGANGLTHEVASFIVNTIYHDLPKEAINLTMRCLIDGVGITLGGSMDQSSVILRQYLESLSGKKESAVLGSKLRVPAPAAAHTPESVVEKLVLKKNKKTA